jgi:imidazole glycerol-phosphate synthase subunit HisF
MIMLRPRIIPCLLMRSDGLVKTVRFAEPKYVGDPINAVRIFNEKEADELIVLDIEATARGREPDYKQIERLALECRMPLCYGGGVNTLEQAKRIVGLGVEKVAMSSAVIARPALITEIAEEIGAQSVVVVLDVKAGSGGTYELRTHNGSRRADPSPFDFARQAQAAGAGEIVLNAIDNDGVMKGYDLTLAKRICAEVSVPVTVLGGAGSLDDVGRLIRECGIVGAAAGSLFVFKGTFKAVLINYPNRAKREEVVASALGRD